MTKAMIREIEPIIAEIVERKLVEILGDPDSRYELEPWVKRRLRKRSSLGGLVAAEKVARDLGLKW